MKPGTIVIPGDSGKERIIGVVVHEHGDGFVDVVWLSDQRGAFACIELSVDLVAATCRGRATVTDVTIAHAVLADALHRLTAPGCDYPLCPKVSVECHGGEIHLCQSHYLDAAAAVHRGAEVKDWLAAAGTNRAGTCSCSGPLDLDAEGACTNLVCAGRVTRGLRSAGAPMNPVNEAEAYLAGYDDAKRLPGQPLTVDDPKCDDCCPVPTCETCGPCAAHDRRDRNGQVLRPGDTIEAGDVRLVYDHGNVAHDIRGAPMIIDPALFTLTDPSRTTKHG